MVVIDTQGTPWWALRSLLYSRQAELMTYTGFSMRKDTFISILSLLLQSKYYGKKPDSWMGRHSRKHLDKVPLLLKQVHMTNQLTIERRVINFLGTPYMDKTLYTVISDIYSVSCVNELTYYEEGDIHLHTNSTYPKASAFDKLHLNGYS